MKKQETKNIEAILAICTGLAIVFWFTDNKVFLILGIILGAGALLSEVLAAFVAKMWYALAAILGAINSKVILTVLYFLVLTPIALLSRLFKKDSLELKKKAREDESYFKIRNHTFESKDLKHPF